MIERLPRDVQTEEQLRGTFRHSRGARLFCAVADAVTELALRGWGDGDDWQEVWDLRPVIWFVVF